jgi:hypothetical protein
VGFLVFHPARAYDLRILTLDIIANEVHAIRSEVRAIHSDVQAISSDLLKSKICR